MPSTSHRALANILAFFLSESQGVCDTRLGLAAVPVRTALFDRRTDSAAALVVAGAVVVLDTGGHALLVGADLVTLTVSDGGARRAAHTEGADQVVGAVVLSGALLNLVTADGGVTGEARLARAEGGVVDGGADGVDSAHTLQPTNVHATVLHARLACGDRWFIIR